RRQVGPDQLPWAAAVHSVGELPHDGLLVELVHAVQSVAATGGQVLARRYHVDAGSVRRETNVFGDKDGRRARFGSSGLAVVPNDVHPLQSFGIPEHREEMARTDHDALQTPALITRTTAARSLPARGGAYLLVRGGVVVAAAPGQHATGGQDLVVQNGLVD